MGARPVSIRVWRRANGERTRGKAPALFNVGEIDVVLKLVAVGALGAFVVAGPLQHVGVLPQTAIGDASNTVIKTVLNVGVKEAIGRCGGGRPKGNNGWGNGEDFAPGNSLANQPKFEDPNTGPTPCSGPRCSGGDR